MGFIVLFLIRFLLLLVTIGYTISPFGKVLMAFLGFTVAGLRLQSLSVLDDIFVRCLKPDFPRETLNDSVP